MNILNIKKFQKKKKKSIFNKMKFYFVTIFSYQEINNTTFIGNDSLCVENKWNNYHTNNIVK